METTTSEGQSPIHPPDAWFYKWRELACESCARQSDLDAFIWERVKAEESWQMNDHIGIARNAIRRYNNQLDEALVAIFTDGCGLYKDKLEKVVSLDHINRLRRLADFLAKQWWNISSLIAARQLHKTIHLYYGLEECAGCSARVGLLFPYQVLGLHEERWYCQGCHEECIYRGLEDFTTPPGKSPITFNHRFLPRTR